MELVGADQVDEALSTCLTEYLPPQQGENEEGDTLPKDQNILCNHWWVFDGGTLHVSGRQQDEKRRKQVLIQNPYRAYSGYPEAESACTAETEDSVYITTCEKSQLEGDKETRPTPGNRVWRL